MWIIKPLRKKLSAEYSGYEDIYANDDQYDTAEDSCFACQVCSEFLTYEDAAEADKEGDYSDEQTTYKRLKEVVFRYGETDGKGINGGGNTLDKQCF